LLGEGRLVNLAMAEATGERHGHELCHAGAATEFCVKNKGKLPTKFTKRPAEVEEYVSRTKTRQHGHRH